MTRHELMERMSGHELAAWIALERVRAKEEMDAEERRRDIAESGDGKVIVSGRDPDADDDDPEEEEDDGEAE